MQTFLPYPDFTSSAKALDNKRLGKQRVECLQILKAISDPTYGWQNHPAVRMWRYNKQALVSYGVIICDEWIKRGFRDTCRGKILSFGKDESILYPKFIDNPAFHASHRSNLLRKDPTHYGQFGWTEPNNLPYVWPV